MSNRTKIKGNVRNKKSGPQVLKVPTPWHSRDRAPTYSEALSAKRRADRAEAKAQGVPYNRRFKKRQKRERIKKHLAVQE